jgi:hypothetical protein
MLFSLGVGLLPGGAVLANPSNPIGRLETASLSKT